MQTAMPLVAPRHQKKKPLLAPHDRSFITSSGLQVTGIPRGQTPAKPKTQDQQERQAAMLNASGPTLVGSLMYLRAQGVKELANTTLHQMDVPQPPIGKTSTVFHGQKYVAEVGYFEMDPRTSSTIKMPLTTATPYQLAMKSGAVAATAANASASTDTRSRKFTPKNQQPLAAPNQVAQTAASHQPVTKKQRTVKGQRAQMAIPNARTPNGQAQAKPPQTPRKSGGSRSSAGTTTNNVKATNSADSHQRPVAVRAPAQSSANNAVSAAISAASAAASRYSAQQQLAMQKKGPLRTMNAPASVAMPRVASGQSLPMATAAGMHITAKGSVRVNKARTHPSPSQTNAALVMRAAAGNKIKTPSPSQASSRSGDRLPMHRGSAMTGSGPYHDPLLLASSQRNATTSAMNRANAVRGVSPKAQLDFQHAMAQVTGQAAGRDMMSGVSRAGIPHASPKGQLLGTGGQLSQGNMRGLPPQARAKQNVAMQNAQARMAAVASHKNRQQVRGQLRKEDAGLLHKNHELESQLRRDALSANMVAGKGGKLNDPSLFGKGPSRNNLVINPAAHVSQGFYSAALAAASAQLGSNAAMKNQQNLALLGLAQANPNAMTAGAGTAEAPSILQNMQDLRPMQNLGVVPGMQQAASNASMLNFLQATGLNGGMAQTGGMNNPVAPGMPGSGMAPGPNAGMFNPSEALLQQILTATRAQGMNQNPHLHGGPMGAPAPPMNHVYGHQGVRAGPMGQIPQRPVVQPSPSAAVDEIDRALESDRALEFDESDLMD